MAYAHCLCGHEYIYKDDFQKAKKCYEIALVIDPKNFNAWWGMGNVYHKQEKYDRALDLFQKANDINEKNPIIWAYLGITHMNNNNFKDA
jgi:anaphase-promoting complex subunit 3